MRIIIYPYSKDFSIFARYARLLRDFTDVVLVSTKGSGLKGKDASVCDGGSMLDNIVSSDLERALSKADAVFFGYSEEIKKETCVRSIRNICKNGNKLYLPKGLVQLISEEVDDKPYTLLSFDETPLEDDGKDILYTIPVPIVLVAGVGKNCGKFQVQLGLKEAFERNGYKVAQWGTKEYSALFGMRPLPQYLFDLHPTKAKIKSFNHHVYDRVTQDKADVAIVGIPGGIMRINPFVFDDFGEYAFIIGNAVNADTGVLCSYAGEINETLIDKLYAICLYRLNMKPQFMSISTTSFTLTAEKKVCEYHTVPTSYIHERVIPNAGKYRDSTFCAVDSSGMARATNGIIDMLRQNI